MVFAFIIAASPIPFYPPTFYIVLPTIKIEIVSSGEQESLFAWLLFVF